MTDKPSEWASEAQDITAWLSQGSQYAAARIWQVILAFAYGKSGDAACDIIALALDAAQREALQEAAQVCASRSEWATSKITSDDSVFGTYGNACDDCEELIRALIDKPPTPSMRSELPGLTGLRGLLALAVLLFHLGLLPGGWLAVDGFFLLSGIVLTFVYGGQDDTGLARGVALSVGSHNWHGLGGNLSGFFRARFARLAPTCVASTVIVVAVGAAQGQHFSPGDIVRTLLVFPLLAGPVGVNGALWSLAVEGCLYLAFPLLLVLVGALGPAARRWCLAACAAGFLALAWRGASGGGFIAGPMAVLRGLFPFLAGMLICGGWNGPSLCEPSLALDSLHAQTSGIRRAHVRTLWMVALQTVRAGLVRSLNSHSIRWLGEISLPLYLCQIVPLRLLGHSLWVIPAAIGLAAAVHYTIEAPGRRLLRSSR